MKKFYQLIATILASVLVFFSLALVANAEEKYDVSKVNEDGVTIHYVSNEAYRKNYNKNSVIGEYDGVAFESSNGISTYLTAKANVRINSYATYDSEKGINVYVKLYCPLYPIFNPKFTSMAGQVSVKILDKKTNKQFTKSANKSSTIEKTVKTGVKAKSLTKGKVSVSGIANAEEALDGGGAFAITYDIQIP
ncbi:hypothetical protein [Eubacterium sp.]